MILRDLITFNLNLKSIKSNTYFFIQQSRLAIPTDRILLLQL